MDNINENAASVEELEALIAEEEKSIEESYAKLGKLCYEKNAAEPAEEYAELVCTIDVAFANINAKKDEIRALKGLIICPQCNAEIAADSYSCPVCSFRLREDVTENGEPICQVCKSVLTFGSRFCNYCGSPLAAPVEPVAEVTADAASEQIIAATEENIPSEAAEQEKRFCLCCGTELISGLAFCTNCGTRAEENSAAPEVIAEEAPAYDENVCKACGAALIDGLAFCTNCGTKSDRPLQPAAAPVIEAKKVCVYCGQELEEGIMFCTNCGTKVEATASADAIAPAASSVVICKNCGTEIAEGTKFCTGCGTSV